LLLPFTAADHGTIILRETAGNLLVQTSARVQSYCNSQLGPLREPPFEAQNQV
jgi:hypothetical protein